jgi:hypothetical protein
MRVVYARSFASYAEPTAQALREDRASTDSRPAPGRFAVWRDQWLPFQCMNSIELLAVDPTAHTSLAEAAETPVRPPVVPLTLSDHVFPFQCMIMRRSRTETALQFDGQ